MNNIGSFILGIAAYGVLDLIIPDFRVDLDKSCFIGIITISFVYYIYRQNKYA